MPEVFYLLPAAPVREQIALGGQAGFRHESNGRDGLTSRSLNTLYIQPVATMPIGKYTLSLGPRLSFYVGSLEDNPDRSEEHTSELQSLMRISYAVFCLKKKTYTSMRTLSTCKSDNTKHSTSN